jgi:hypothetical protein
MPDEDAYRRYAASKSHNTSHNKIEYLHLTSNLVLKLNTTLKSTHSLTSQGNTVIRSLVIASDTGTRIALARLIHACVCAQLRAERLILTLVHV